MKASVAVALLSAVVALTTAGVAAVVSWRSVTLRHSLEEARDDRIKQESVAEVAATYSKPLLWSAYELAARLYHICSRNWLHSAYSEGHFRQREYAELSTQFVFAQYFTWVEILRRRIQFLDVGDDRRTHELQNLIEQVEHYSSSERYPWPHFQTFRMELRGVAEIMTEEGPEGSMQCIGYATFVKFLNEPDSQLKAWLTPFADGLTWLSSQEDSSDERLAHIQRSLSDLIGFLDPEHIRLPDRRVNRVAGNNRSISG